MGMPVVDVPWVVVGPRSDVTGADVGVVTLLDVDSVDGDELEVDVVEIETGDKVEAVIVLGSSEVEDTVLGLLLLLLLLGAAKVELAVEEDVTGVVLSFVCLCWVASVAFSIEAVVASVVSSLSSVPSSPSSPSSSSSSSLEPSSLPLPDSSSPLPSVALSIDSSAAVVVSRSTSMVSVVDDTSTAGGRFEDVQASVVEDVPV